MTSENPGNLTQEQFESIATPAARRTTVGQLLDWGREEPHLFLSQGTLTDVVVQDEFTHDVVVKLSSGLVLVYDST
jgi:hypothetical protein